METKCNICGCAFANNKGGQLTNHLLKVHNLSYKDYYVLVGLEGCPPVCECGCNQQPEFYRGKFKKYAKGHNTFLSKEQQYKIKNNIPKCKTCNNDVLFYRGKPNQFCSFECSGKQTGFSLLETQNKIRKVVLEKYGVDNVSKLEEVKRKIAVSHILNPRVHNVSEETRTIISSNSKIWWSKLSAERKNEVCAKLKASCNTPEEKQRRKILAEKYIAGKYFSVKNKFSKLHLKIRKQLNLQELGFVGEQKINRFLVDELNEDKKIIIEINGDYVHANPNKYSADILIRLRGNSYYAEEKWFTDKIKIDKLNELGYKVLVVWESDDIEKIKSKLNQLL
jgi:very-short-patch-repair endonuclease